MEFARSVAVALAARVLAALRAMVPAARARVLAARAALVRAALRVLVRAALRVTRAPVRAARALRVARAPGPRVRVPAPRAQAATQEHPGRPAIRLVAMQEAVAPTAAVREASPATAGLLAMRAQATEA
jgi:hypothetical protein